MADTERRPAPDLTPEQLNVLMAPLKQARVAHRSQGGVQLSYLEAWDVKAMLTRVFGFGSFSSDLLEYRVEHAEQYENPKKKGSMLWRIAVSARVRLTVHSLGCTYTEAAAGSQSGPEFGDVLDFALKTAESDALKRAAINLGTQFGLSLYNSGSTRDVVRVILAPEQRWEFGKRAEETIATQAPSGETRSTDDIEAAEASIGNAFGATRELNGGRDE